MTVMANVFIITSLPVRFARHPIVKNLSKSKLTDTIRAACGNHGHANHIKTAKYEEVEITICPVRSMGDQDIEDLKEYYEQGCFGQPAEVVYVFMEFITPQTELLAKIMGKETQNSEILKTLGSIHHYFPQANIYAVWYKIYCQTENKLTTSELWNWEKNMYTLMVPSQT